VFVFKSNGGCVFRWERPFPGGVQEYSCRLGPISVDKPIRLTYNRNSSY